MFRTQEKNIFVATYTFPGNRLVQESAHSFFPSFLQYFLENTQMLAETESHKKVKQAGSPPLNLYSYGEGDPRGGVQGEGAMNYDRGAP